MQFKEALARLQKDKVYTDWSKQNPNHYLAHGFFMKDKMVQESWQIGFYNKGEDRIVTFTIEEPITKNPPSELFKQESGVEALTAKDVVVELNEALKIAEEHREENFKEHEPAKTIILLQKLSSGQLWNITFVTNTFSVCNIKIDTKSGTIISSSCESLLGWAKTDDGTDPEEM